MAAPGGVMTWEDQQRTFLQAVEWERKLQTFILLFLLLTATGILQLLAYEATPEKAWASVASSV